jgi:hypothetical protein
VKNVTALYRLNKTKSLMSSQYTFVIWRGFGDSGARAARISARMRGGPLGS